MPGSMFFWRSESGLRQGRFLFPPGPPAPFYPNFTIKTSLWCTDGTVFFNKYFYQFYYYPSRAHLIKYKIIEKV